MITRMFLFYRVERAGASNMIRQTEQIVEVPATNSPQFDRIAACKVYYQDRVSNIPNLVVAELRNAKSVPDVFVLPPREDDPAKPNLPEGELIFDASDFGLRAGQFPDELRAMRRVWKRSKMNYNTAKTEVVSVEYVWETRLLTLMND